MFLKAGESLVSGIATRVFASIQALVPTDLGSQKVMKLLAFRLEGFDKAATEAEMGKVVSELVAILKGLAGVDHVEADAKALAVRAEYNASTITPEDIERKVQLKGLRMVR
jgi:galactitol-specific phosphotransferase system IIC component